MKKARTAGKLKVWHTRLASYISLINFIMIFYLYIIESPLGIKWHMWFIVISLVCVVTLYVDIKYIFPNYQIYTFEKNPEFVKIRKDLNEIKSLLKAKKNE